MKVQADALLMKEGKIIELSRFWIEDKEICRILNTNKRTIDKVKNKYLANSSFQNKPLSNMDKKNLVKGFLTKSTKSPKNISLPVNSDIDKLIKKEWKEVTLKMFTGMLNEVDRLKAEEEYSVKRREFSKKVNPFDILTEVKSIVRNKKVAEQRG